MTIRHAGEPPTIVLTGLVEGVCTIDESDLRAYATPATSTPPGTLVVRLAALFAAASVQDNASHVSAVSDDGLYVASIPLTHATSGGQIYLGDGVPLTRDAGGPFRLIVEDGRTLCWNVKAVSEMRFTEGPEPDSVPESPTH